MSRVGSKEIIIPDNVKVSVEGENVYAEGPMGKLESKVNKGVLINIDGNKITMSPENSNKATIAFWGLQRNLLNNIILGCINEFKKVLKLVGTGYKAQLQGKILKISAGYSHDIDYEIPEGINVKCADANTIEISGSNKTQVGQVAADIRSFRKPEPYKGKGIKYENEYIFRKEGKKK